MTVSHGVVRYYIAGRKPEILVESGKAPLEALSLRPTSPAMRRKSTSVT